ncbi:MAG TPA: endo-beta-N-acetylglucosaminidase H [Pseudonocardiaceae bacterium]|nr:endo-beta-N-acetylglucosaminidase H [Pseudonocardiaceae bacterium]
MFTSGRVRARLTVLALMAAAAIGTTAITPAAAAQAKTGPISVAYIEVNSNSMVNVGKYTLANGGGNVFDIGVIFAANINYNTSTNAAYLYFNPQVQSVLNNVSTQIRPLQAKGIKVELSILGNHEGAGFANFPSQSAASAFARQLSDAVTKYGLDGIDFDDEYADYGTNGTGQPNASSFVYLVSALRQDMPSKLITLYDIGPAASSLSYGGTDVTHDFNYAWNPWYGSWMVPSISLPKSDLSPAAIEIGATSTSTAASLAQQTVSNGYGVYLTYNLDGSDEHTYLSSFTQKLYGSAAVYHA